MLCTQRSGDMFIFKILFFTSSLNKFNMILVYIFLSEKNEYHIYPMFIISYLPD